MKSEIQIGAAAWTDLTDPPKDEMESVAKQYQLHPVFVRNCLDPEHLPKVEKFDGGWFVMIRVFDTVSSSQAATVQQLTRKLAMFLSESALLTVHRASLPFLEEFRTEVKESIGHAKDSPFSIFLKLCSRAVLTLERPLELAEAEIERLDMNLSGGVFSHKNLIALHRVRRRLSCLKHLLWHTSTVFQRLPVPKEASLVSINDLKETVDSLLFFSDELLEDANSLTHLHISMASQKTNEIIKVLTVFSVFFMPLTFIVGIYGMNFEHMPELKWSFGYYWVLLLMICVTIGIAMWFQKKKLL